MKKLLVILALIAVTVSGCVTTPQGTQTLDIAKTTNAINAVVPIAVRLAVQKEPAARQYLADAAVAISVFATSSTTFDPAALNAAIQASVGGDPLNADALAAIDAAVALYKVYYGDAVIAKLNNPAWLLPVLQSLSASIQTGLN